MIVSATEFQKRPGYYLKLAENGKKIFIKKGKTLISLSIDFDVPNNLEQRFDFEKFIAAAKQIKVTVPNHDGVAFQRRMRS